MQDIFSDLRFAMRQLFNVPGFTCTAVFVLALGISATLAIFGFVDAALIKPLPYRETSRLVSVYETTATTPSSASSYRDYLDWRNLNSVFSSIDGYGGSDGWSYTLSTAEGAQHVPGIHVTDGFFRTLGVSPVLGRDFRVGEDLPAAPNTIMLSYSTWRERFGGRRDVLGQSVTLDGVPSIIIGVLPRDFHFAPAGPAEFWGTLRGSRPCEQNRACHSVYTVARLKEGVSIQTALADMKSIARQLQRRYPDSNRGQGANVVLLSDAILGGIRPMLLMLLTGAGLLLVIACINVSSLVLARSDTRKREIAVRNALGASSARLLRQFATEALLLATLGCLAGLLFAAWGMRFLTSIIPSKMMESMPYLHGLGLSWHVVAFACWISLGAGVLFSVAPLLRVSLSEMMAGLKEGSRGSAGTMWRRLGANLVVFELALAVVLLVSAGLLGKSLYRLLEVDTGFNPNHLATLQIELPGSDSKDQQIVALKRQVLGGIANLPGVQSAAVSDQLPLSFWGGTAEWFDVVGRPNHGERNEASNRVLSSGYFTTLEARLLRGRYFSSAEEASKRPLAIINQRMAKQYFPGQDPVGKQISYTLSSQPPMQIVGVVADIKEGSLDTGTRPAFYVPFDQNPTPEFCIVVRTSQAAQSLFPSLAARIHRIDPAIAIHDEVTMTERMNELPSAYLHRSSAWLVGGFAAIALLLGVVGLYAVIAYSVSQRTREIGVRMALGAQPKSVYQLILGEAAWLGLTGTALGIVGAVGAATLIRQMLFGVRSWDVPTLAAVAAVLIFSALLASYIPARRAASVNPVDALRAE